MTERLRPGRALLLPTLVAFLLLFAPGARAAWRAVGAVTSCGRMRSGVVLTLTSGAGVSVAFADAETVRVRLAPRGPFERDISYAVATLQREDIKATITEARDEIRVSSLSGAPVLIKRRPFLVTVLDDDGRTVVEDDPARPPSFDTGTGAVECSKKRVEWETYYGLGEKAAPTLSRDTQQFVMWNTDTYAYPRGLDPIYQSIGFLIALRHEKEAGATGRADAGGRGTAYGLFLDNTTRTYFDLGKTDPSR